MKKGIDHIGIYVCAFCHDADGNYLFMKRGTGARDEHGCWNPTPGGTLELFETVEDCLVREVEEEIGTKPKNPVYIGHRDLFRNIDGQETHWLGFYFRAKVDRAAVKLMEPEVYEMHDWRTMNDLPNPMISKFDETLAMFIDKL